MTAKVFVKLAYVALFLSFEWVASASAEEIKERVCSDHLVSVGDDGAVIRGSKARLAKAVESGHAIRVGFGLGKGPTGGFFLTHWFEAKFLTVLGEDVFTQTPIIHRQAPQRQEPDILLPTSSQQWIATIGTNGKLHSKFLDEEKVSDFNVYSWWCLAE